MSEFDRQFRKFRKAANSTPEEIARVSEAARHVTEEVLQTYTLELIGPSWEPPWSFGPEMRFRLSVAAHMKETEENLSDLLPEDYEVRIREWDAEEEQCS